MRAQRNGADLPVSCDGSAQGSGEIGRQQAVKEVLTGLTADRQPSGDVGARAEPALNRVANRHVLVLHDFAYGDAFLVACFGGGAGIGEVVVENYRTAVY